MQKALKIGLIALMLGCGVQNASAFWRCGGCCWSSCCCYCPAPCYPCGSACPYTAPAAAPATPPASAAPKTSLYSPRPAATSVRLTVNVPADAKVFVNDQPTTSTGERREYTSSNLRSTATYAYRVRAEFVRDGKPVTEEQMVQVSAGQIGSFEFKGPTGAQVANVAKAGRR